MNHVPHQLPGSRIRYREEGEQLELYLPPNFRGLAVAVPVALVLVAAIVFALLMLDLPPVAAAGLGLPMLFFLVLFAAAVRPHLMRTWVTITRDGLTLKTIGYAKVKVQRFGLGATSRAKKSWVEPRTSASPPHRSRGGYYQGVDVENCSAGETDETVHFGDSLRRSEGAMEWIVWRINRFLGHPTDAQVAIVAADRSDDDSSRPAEQVVPPAPKGTRLRIEEHGGETRVHFPNARETGRWRGAGSILLGLALLAYPSWSLLRRLTGDAPAVPSRPAEVAAILFVGLIALLGLAELMKGLNRLLGRRTLSIAPDWIVYRATVLGIPFARRLRTSEVLLTRGFEIHTAHHKVAFNAAARDAVRSQAEAGLLAREITRRTQAAHHGAAREGRIAFRRGLRGQGTLH